VAADPYKYFRIEAKELLEGLSRGVLALEKGERGPEQIGQMLRLAHTLKGAARVVKLHPIADLAHSAEDVLAAHRSGGEPLPAQRIQGLFDLLAQVGGHLRALDGGTPRETPEAFETVRVEIREMDAILEGITETSIQLTSLDADADSIERARQALSSLRSQMDPNGSAPSPLRLKARLDEIHGALERASRRLKANAQATARDLSQVLDLAGRARLVPAAALFPEMERTASDAARSLGKHVKFEASGGEHRLDAHVLAALRGALAHAVRNAVAHGVETEKERIAAGKPPLGNVRLHVERRGHRVTFRCEDDGAGVDSTAVGRAAVQQGLLSVAEADALGTEEAARFVLRGGLSTVRGPANQVSGRGVGLDVLRETVARLRGFIDIWSQRGKGTRIEVSVPVSLSSVAALLVEAGTTAASIPLDSVERALRLQDSDIVRSAGTESVMVGGGAIPFRRLGAVLGAERTPAKRARACPVIVVRVGAKRAAIGVDRLLGAADVVVRPLPSWMTGVKGVDGASLDAHGNPRLALDPEALVEAAQASPGALASPSESRRAAVLVVDDSLTTRMLEQSILESAGYEVELATSGEEALTKAHAARYGLFLVDVEMPGMDGFEFVQRTRLDPALRETPAILVTSRNGPEDRRKGEEVGAHAYIVKSEFDQRQLLETIGRLLG
jgi:two-component system, chemotaxis family, sensor kinase CheA